MVAIVAFSTAIGPVPIDCVLTERHTSELDITEIAIETGSKITDHAIVVPKRLSLDVANADGASSYNSLVAFQESRVPFTIVSGLSV
ncbi:phage baseplate protein, partial [Pseudomonas monteilii]|uniref:phage baseplate protein n=1 Tax=Pseudomonas monteilii TaxID=76759 RepID=UPI001F223EAF